jgi:ribosomal protein S15P/S13E
MRRVLAPWIAISVVLIVACGALVIGLFATSASYRTAKCVNHILGTRNQPAVKDNRSQIQFAESVLTAITLPSTLTPPEQQAALTALVTEVRSHVNTLIADQKARDSHPLGKC